MNSGAREPEPVQYSRPAAKPSPLAQFLTEPLIVIGLGCSVGLGMALVAALTIWMLLGRGGISDAMPYLPNDCLIVGTANVDELMSSSTYQQMKKDLPTLDESEREIEQNAGIAPSNISRITFAAGKVNSPSDSDVVVVIRLKKAVSATDIKSNKKVMAYQKDVKYEELKIGNVTVFEQTYRLHNDKAEREHGMAFCMPESTLMVTCPKLEVLKRTLERGKSPELSEGMQNAMREVKFSKTMAVAVNVKGAMSSEALARELSRNSENSSVLTRRMGMDEQFLQNFLWLAIDYSLDSSKATVSATLMCKDAKIAEDTKKILDGGQVVIRNELKRSRGVPREMSDIVDSIKFSVNEAKVKGSLQTSTEPLSKWIVDRQK